LRKLFWFWTVLLLLLRLRDNWLFVNFSQVPSTRLTKYVLFANFVDPIEVKNANTFEQFLASVELFHQQQSNAQLQLDDWTFGEKRVDVNVVCVFFVVHAARFFKATKFCIFSFCIRGNYC
jgi:hypothetical protein